jgi:hypothetical protein
MNPPTVNVTHGITTIPWPDKQGAGAPHPSHPYAQLVSELVAKSA